MVAIKDDVYFLKWNTRDSGVWSLEYGVWSMESFKMVSSFESSNYIADTLLGYAS